jgi:hypothetical protein
MRKLLILTLGLAMSATAMSQLQTSDYEGTVQAGNIKKINKKAKYGAYLIEKKISFGTGKGLDKQPVVTATEKGNVEMVSVESKADIGYLVYYNNFVKLKDYDFAIFYRNAFKSQKYPPQRVSLTDNSIYLDDS